MTTRYINYNCWGVSELIDEIHKANAKINKGEERIKELEDLLDIKKLQTRQCLEIPFSQGDIEEMMTAEEGEVFDWCFPTDRGEEIDITIKKQVYEE